MATKYSPDKRMIKQKTSTRRNFTSYEDKQLKDLVGQYGKSNWKIITEKMEERTARQCKEHWINKLDPDKNRATFTSEEHQIILDKLDLFGSQWSRIAQFLDHRSPDDVKNEFRRMTKSSPAFVKHSLTDDDFLLNDIWDDDESNTIDTPDDGFF
jgi:hypothetical protein